MKIFIANVLEEATDLNSCYSVPFRRLEDAQAYANATIDDYAQDYDGNVTERASHRYTMQAGEQYVTIKIAESDIRESYRRPNDGGVIDLSFYDFLHHSETSKQNTANCYVVRKTGSYKFPLVYGNAIADGKENAHSFANYVDHRNDQITDARIAESLGIEESSMIPQFLWEDKPGSIKDIYIADGYIHFTCDTLDSNAVIAVASAGTILWSWHIWATSVDLHEVEITNKDGKKFSILSHNIGAVADDNLYSMLYQWGRKDPFSNKPDYFPETFDGRLANKGYTITHPTAFIINSGKWCEDNASWDAHQGSSPCEVVKTIYDPSPVGFSVPCLNAFTGFADNNFSPVVVDNFDDRHTFKANPNDKVGVFFPASGYRSHGYGSAYDFGSRGYYWLSVPSSSDSSRSLTFGSSGIYPQVNSTRALGFAVRPARI